MWREGRVREALAAVLPLRDEGVRVLRHDQRGVLLNTIAGCYSALGDSAQAFAHMFEALRDAGPSRGRGFDTVLHCNLSHELMQIGDYEHALQHVDQGLAGCTRLKNARLQSVLLINRVVCLTELGRAAESLPDVARGAGHAGRSRRPRQHEPAFETLAIAALRAGDAALGAELVARAQAGGTLADPRRAHRARHRRRRCSPSPAVTPPARCARCSRRATKAGRDDVDGLSMRIRAQFFAVLSEAHEAAGDSAGALAALRRWQRLHRAQSQLASRARYQAADAADRAAAPAAPPRRERRGAARTERARARAGGDQRRSSRTRSTRCRRCRPRCASRPRATR